jgi:hypothetical protein
MAWKGWMVVALVMLGALICAAQIPVPNTFYRFLGIPYTVDSIFFRYPGDGSQTIDMYDTAYSQGGTEVVLTSSIPGRPLVTAIRKFIDSIGFLFFRLKPASRPLPTGCSAGPVDQGEAILNVPTLVKRTVSERNRVTLWMAPSLDCFPLRLTLEERLPGMPFQMVRERVALRINATR